MRYILILFGLLFSSAVFSESLSYSLTQEKLLWWDKEIISEGTVVYDISDIVVEERNGFTSKYLPVFETFNIGASIFREKEKGGFGLWIDKNGDGFSWEWFTPEEGNVFKKLQESGRVLVNYHSYEGLYEIESIEFLEDVSMRLDTLYFIPFWFKKTHRMLVKKGSVLIFLPPDKTSNTNTFGAGS